MIPLPDKKEFRRRVLWRVFSSPMNLIPMTFGATVILAAWALALQGAGIWFFVGVCSMLAALGISLSRLILSSETEGKKVLEKMRREVIESQETSLDVLEKELEMDDDPRTETCLRDLRTLTRQFREESDLIYSRKSRLDVYSSMEISSKVEELFNNSVEFLKKTMELWNTANQLESPSARAPLMKIREKLIQDVGKSIEQISKSLAEIQQINSGMLDTKSDLERIRMELEQQVNSVRKISGDIEEFDRKSLSDAGKDLQKSPLAESPQKVNENLDRPEMQ